MALTNKLSAIGDAIRAKTGKTALLSLDDMPTEIRAISGGGGGAFTEEELTFTGAGDHLFRSPLAALLVEKCGSSIKTKDLTSATYMFGSGCTVKSIPFPLNFKASSAYHQANSMFGSSLEHLPTVVNFRPNELSFRGCNILKEVSDEWLDSIDWSYMDSLKGSYDSPVEGECISNMYAIRKFPNKIYEHGNPNRTSTSSAMINNVAESCYVLDEIVGLPLTVASQVTYTSNAFSYALNKASRLKRFTFALDPATNAPYVVNWKSQTLDLSKNTGWASGDYYMTGYGAGITTAKCVSNDATYQALKNDPDWYSNYASYSRYTHDSAVETINSLPDTSAYLAANGGTNTIKFKGTAGSSTDGGAISNLTEEEIAVATARGWTVTLE